MEGETIIDTVWERYYTGRYSWHGDSIPGFDQLSGHTIAFADASCILTDKGLLVFYSYMDGGLRYFNKDEEINLPKADKPATYGYTWELSRRA